MRRNDFYTHEERLAFDEGFRDGVGNFGAILFVVVMVVVCIWSYWP